MLLALLCALFLLLFPLRPRNPWFRHSRGKIKPITAGKAAHPCRHAPKPAWVTDEIIRLKALMPGAGCRHIATSFNRLHLPQRGMSVSKSHVAMVVRKHQYDILQRRREIKHRIPRPQARNQTWGLDLTGKQDAWGEVHSILAIIDHGSRKALCLESVANRSAWTLLGHVFLAVGRWGRPQAVRTDNDGAFRSPFFARVLQLAGIRHQRTDPGCPWQNGRVERFFRTLKEQLDWVGVSGREGLGHLLKEFGVWYNHVRPHLHLGLATPEEAWQGIDPLSNPVKEVRWFEGWEGRLQGFYLRR